jgi:osmotically inducible lipoprotein OsmB
MKDQSMMSKLRAPILGIALLSLTACSGMSTTQQRTLSGAGIGAGVGAVGTAMTGGCVGCGAAIGAGAGAVGGYIYDQTQKNRE